MVPGSDSNKWESLSFNGFVNHLAYNIIEGILAVIIWTLFFWLVGSHILEKIWENFAREEEKRMFKGIEDSAIANIMSSIEEFKTKYLN